MQVQAGARAVDTNGSGRVLENDSSIDFLDLLKGLCSWTAPQVARRQGWSGIVDSRIVFSGILVTSGDGNLIMFLLCSYRNSASQGARGRLSLSPLILRADVVLFHWNSFASIWEVYL